MNRSQNSWFPEAPSAEMAELVEQVCHGELSEEHDSRLKTLVTTDECARQFYLRYMNMHASLPSLMGAYEADLMADEAKVQLSERSSGHWIHRRRVGASIWGAAIAVNVVLVFLLALAVSPRLREQIGWEQEPQVASTPADSIAEPVNASAIRIISAQDCRWAGSTNVKPRIGVDLTSRVLQLESGVAELACGDSVRLAICGPTTIELPSYKSVQLNAGSLLVRVGALGRGFTVVTPGATIVDLGTEFGVEVTTAGDTEVQMLDGLAEIAPNSPSKVPAWKKLKAGQAARVAARGESPQVINPVAFNPRSFASLSDRLHRTGDKANRLKLVSGGKPVSSPDTFLSPTLSFSPAAVTDGRLRDLGSGNDWSYWVARDGAASATLTVDLLEEFEIAEIRLQPTHNGIWQNRSTKDFRILVSENGTDYTTAIEGTLPCVFERDEVSSECYPLRTPLHGRYVQFEALSYYGLAAGLNEIQVFTSTD